VAISDGALIPGQPSGPAPGLAGRTRSAVPVAALPRRGERNRGRGDAEQIRKERIDEPDVDSGVPGQER